MNRIAVSLVAACVLAGCSNSGPGGQPSAERALPSAQDALAALRGANRGEDGAIYNAGAPLQCATGEAGGARVTACKVCVVYIDYHRPGGGLLYDGLAAHRVLVPITFKRGLSFQQPDVTPDTGGVWVLANRINVADEQFAPRTNNRFEPGATSAYLGIEMRRSDVSALVPAFFSNGVELRGDDLWRKIESIDVTSMQLPENLTPNCPVS